MSEPISNAPAQSRATSHRRGGWWFLLGVILLYLLIALFDAGYATASLRHFLKMGYALLPALILVFLFLWLMNLGQGMNQRLARAADRDSGLRGWVIAVGGGILSHGPVYAWYPLLRELRKQGMRPALIAAFLYARSIKLPWLPVMAQYFGLGYMLILTFYMALFSVVNGWLVGRIMGSDHD